MQKAMKLVGDATPAGLVDLVQTTQRQLSSGTSVPAIRDSGSWLVGVILDSIARYPYATAAQIAAAVTLVAPGLFVAPILSAVGFSAIGPTAGSAAAAYQSANGATWLFSGLQSAAMGGYGTAAVYSTAQACSVTAASVATWWKGTGFNPNP